MKLLWPRIAQLYCRQCGQPVRKDSAQQIWQALSNAELQTPNAEFLITFDLPLTEKLSLEESLGLIAKQGYQRLLVRGDKTAPRFVITDESCLEFNEAIAPWGTIQANPTPSPAA